MRIRKFIPILALLALVLGQVSLAQHSVAHIDHGFSYDLSVSHDNHEHPEDQQKHQCPECILTQSLMSAFYHAPALLPISSHTAHGLPTKQFVAFLTKRNQAHAPRAPPSFLI